LPSAADLFIDAEPLPGRVCTKLEEELTHAVVGAACVTNSQAVPPPRRPDLCSRDGGRAA